ncbi:glycoside hydrolase family 30 protein [Streptomyces sp. NPDC000941]
MSDSDDMTPEPAVTWIVTTSDLPWQTREGASIGPITAMPDAFVRLDAPAQSVEGFGACFSAQGWKALSALDKAQRNEVLSLLFAPDEGAGFALCRMPIGASDFALDWYSYDEVDGDFALDHFSIAQDLDTLVPFIRAAQAHRPDLRLWASPWSPPSWLKSNQHYAGAMPPPHLVGVSNGLRPEQEGREGTDMMNLDDRYLATYAAYFGRFIDAYRAEGISIGMVMPQNEFNSPQPFPSCTWTPEGLVRFVRHLGPEMRRRGVEVFAGTLERGDEALLEPLFKDVTAAGFLSGAGFQWEGKRAVAAFRSRHPEMRIYQTEQECGDGRNDWRHCRYAWSQIRHYLHNGANAYMYWNLALDENAVSTWGWRQNSLVTVDTATGTYTLNHEYYVMRHVSQFVRPGARVFDTATLNGYENLLTFANPDGSFVVVVHNDLAQDDEINVMIGDRLLKATLPADSFNTFVVPPAG